MDKIQNERDFRTDQLANSGLRFVNFIVDSAVIAIIYYLLNKNYSITNYNGISRLNGLTLFIFISYYTLFEWLASKTIGKFITKTTVLNDNGSKLSLGTALLRTLVRLIPLVQWTYIGSTCYGWPDKFSKTIVIPDKEL